MTTLKELSKHLGLSVTQVSRALNNHSDVSKATKERVQNAAKELNYRPNLVARRLVTGRSGIVGLIYPIMPGENESWFFTRFVAGLSATFGDLGRQFMLHIDNGDGDVLKSYDDLARTRSIDGFVVTSPKVEDARINFLRDRKIPFVLHGQTMDVPDYPFYDIDNFAVGYDLTRHLVENGHRDIAFINGPAGDSFVERRRLGYTKALQEAGIALRPELYTNCIMTEENGLLETIRLFQSPDRKPTAIVASNTMIARGIWKALGHMGLSIPDDVSLVAHDDARNDLRDTWLHDALTRTVAPLTDSWAPLAKFLDLHLKGEDLEKVQKIGPHSFDQGHSVRNQ